MEEVQEKSTFSKKCEALCNAKSHLVSFIRLEENEEIRKDMQSLYLRIEETFMFKI